MEMYEKSKGKNKLKEELFSNYTPSTQAKKKITEVTLDKIFQIRTQRRHLCILKKEKIGPLISSSRSILIRV
jgi:hypothetical protein